MVRMSTVMVVAGRGVGAEEGRLPKGRAASQEKDVSLFEEEGSGTVSV